MVKQKSLNRHKWELVDNQEVCVNCDTARHYEWYQNQRKWFKKVYYIDQETGEIFYRSPACYSNQLILDI